MLAVIYHHLLHQLDDAPFLDRADAAELGECEFILLFQDLAVVAFLPFPTRLFADYIGQDGAERVAATIYGTRRWKPEPRWPWWTFCGTLTLFLIGGTLRSVSTPSISASTAPLATRAPMSWVQRLRYPLERAAMREVRIALLEADVALPVVRSFIEAAVQQSRLV